jgi:hypothetical protein
MSLLFFTYQLAGVLDITVGKLAEETVAILRVSELVC